MEKTMEQRAAELLDQLGSLTGEGKDSLTAQLKAIRTDIEGLKQLDIAKSLEEIEKLRAAQETMAERIRTTRSGVYVPGLEDETKNFSLVRFVTGCAKGRGDWTNVGAGLEYEVCKAVHAKAAQSVGDDNLGGYFVPDQVIPDVIAAIYARSTFIALDGEGETSISVVSGLTGGNVTIPKFDGGVVGYWIGEEGSYTESLALTEEVAMQPKKAGVLVKLTEAMRRMGAYGFESLLRRDMVKAVASLIDTAVMYGTGGANSPRGVAHTPDIKVFSAEDQSATGGNVGVVANNATALATLNGDDWQGAEFDFTTLDKMSLALEEDDIAPDRTSKTVFAPRMRRRMANLRIENYAGQTANAPYLLGAPMLTEQQLAAVIGSYSSYNGIATNKLPGAAVNATTTQTATKYSDVLHGNLGEILLGRWGGIEVEDDGGNVNFTTDHTLLKLRMRMDLTVRQPRAIVLCPDARARD